MSSKIRIVRVKPVEKIKKSKNNEENKILFRILKEEDLMFLAYDNDKFAGYISINHIESINKKTINQMENEGLKLPKKKFRKCLHIIMAYVEEKYRQKKIFSSMYDELEKYAENEKYAMVVYVLLKPEARERSKKILEFFKQRGFEEYYREKNEGIWIQKGF